MELLILLVSRKGALVSREEIVGRLWGPEVFVDSEHGINTAVRKIRRALNDDPERPQFVETVVGKGYRFVFPVTTRMPAVEESDIRETAQAGPSRWLPGRSARLLWITVTAGILLLASFLLWNGRGWRDLLSRGEARVRIESLCVLPLENLSGDPSEEYFVDGMTDELITNLARLGSVRVISRTSSMQYKSNTKNDS